MAKGGEGLLVVLGGTPQVVTETLFGLSVGGNPPVTLSQLHLIGTRRSAVAARRHLLPRGGAIDRLARAYGGWVAPPRPYRFHLLRGADGRPIEDVRTSRDNKAVARQILEIVRALVSSTDVLHGSLAGGRKTIGLYLALAFQLFGRRQDRLYHVLVPDSAENNGEFFFPQPGSRVRVDLAELPFPRLAQLLPAKGARGATMERLIKAVQSRLDERQTPDLDIEPGADGRYRVTVGGVHVACRNPDAELWARLAALRAGCHAQGAVGCSCCFLRADQVAPWVRTAEPASKPKLLRVMCSRIRGSLRRSAIPAGWIEEVCVRRVGPRGKLRYGVALQPRRIRVVTEEVESWRAT